jgi:hypothetical protein
MMTRRVGSGAGRAGQDRGKAERVG